MANVITGNPWTLDTVTAAPVLAANVKVRHFEFIDYVADTDTATVLDGAGRVAWKANGAADLEPVRSGHVGVIHDGLYLSQISNGVIRVYIE